VRHPVTAPHYAQRPHRLTAPALGAVLAQAVVTMAPSDGPLSVRCDAAAKKSRYSHGWQPKRAWAGSYRQVLLRLTVGTTHPANFRLK
jgi:hypothetical protein